MAILWRANPRKLRTSLFSQLIARSSGAQLDEWSQDAFFGLVGQASTGQGSVTTDGAAEAQFTAAPITTGQGSQTSDATGTVTVFCVVDTGQGAQTSDGLAQTPFVAVVETGQGEQTSDIVSTWSAFQVIKAHGFHDGSFIEGTPPLSFWRINPRAVNNFFGAFIPRDATSASASVAEDNFFTERSFDGIGDAFVDFGARPLYPSGIDESVFGSHTVFNSTQYVVTPGIGSEEAFGAASVFTLDQHISTTGMCDTAFGTPSLENLNRTIYPQRIDPTLVFGTAEVIGPRYISGATAGDDSAIGDHEAAGSRTVYPSGTESTVALGTPYIAFSTRDVRPSSVLQPSNQVPAVLIGNAGRDMDVYGIGNEDVGMGDPIIGEPPFDVIWGAGVGDASEFGEHDFDMIGATRRIRPGWPINNPSIRTEFGTARIIPHTIHPTNVNTPAYGRPVVSNKIRYIDLSVGERGISSMRIGTHWVSNYIRYVQPAGFDHSEVWWPFGPVPAGQAAAVRHVSDGKLYPGSITDGAFGEPTVRANLC